METLERGSVMLGSPPFDCRVSFTSTVRFGLSMFSVSPVILWLEKEGAEKTFVSHIS